jgi:DNA helicase HerA-like ATPase
MNLDDIRLKEHVGFITSETSTSEFNFFVIPLSNKIGVEQNDFVMVDHPILGEMFPLLAVVKEIKNYVEVVGATMNERSVKSVSVCEIIGYMDLRDPQTIILHRSSIPPNPGSKVNLPYHEFLEDLFTRTPDGKRFITTLHLGKLNSHATSKKGGRKPLNFFYDANEFTKQHILVTGMSGTGKTHIATVIVEELANKTNKPIVILDSFSEYTTIGTANESFKDKVKKGIIPSDKYPFNFNVLIYAIHPDEVKDILEKQVVTHEKDSRYIIRPIPQQWTDPSKETISEIESKLSKDVKPNQVTIIDSNGLQPKERHSLFTRCVEALWSCRTKKTVEPFVLIVGEDNALEEETLKKISSEGRKIGVSMCLLSQHPAEINGLVMSQMGTQFMGRTTIGTDIECLRNFAEENVQFLSQLRTGEWIVNGMTLIQPTRIFVRDRYSLN